MKGLNNKYIDFCNCVGETVWDNKSTNTKCLVREFGTVSPFGSPHPGPPCVFTRVLTVHTPPSTWETQGTRISLSGGEMVLLMLCLLECTSTLTLIACLSFQSLLQYPSSCLPSWFFTSSPFVSYSLGFSVISITFPSPSPLYTFHHQQGEYNYTVTINLLLPHYLQPS